MSQRNTQWFRDAGWDVPIEASGLIPQPSVDQLRAISEAGRGVKIAFVTHVMTAYSESMPDIETARRSKAGVRTGLL